MGAYILRRLLLMIPTIVGIMAISFAVIQFAPGGPVEQVIAQLTGQGDSATDRISGGGGDDPGLQSQDFGDSVTSHIAARRGSTPNSSPSLSAVRLRQATARALLPDDVELSRFDFGESYFRDVAVIDLIIEKLPVSISLGLWMTLLSYG
jgi:microcin C transport system permease protein